jgi:Zn-dependent membrane protease YugP
MFEDSTFWLFVAPGLLLGLYAQARIKANYVRYSRVGTTGGIAGRWRENCWMRADSKGCRLNRRPVLNDHYDPQSSGSGHRRT